MSLILNDYYTYRGWTEDGIPKKEMLEKLDIEYAGYSSHIKPRRNASSGSKHLQAEKRLIDKGTGSLLLIIILSDGYVDRIMV